MPAIKEQIRQIIAGNNLNSVADVYNLLKDDFKDTLQELMEAGLGSGAEPDNCPVRGTAHPVSIKRKRWNATLYKKHSSHTLFHQH